MLTGVVGPNESICLFLLYALGNPTVKFNEFRMIYNKIINSLDTTGKVQFEDALLFCDSFYYTLKASFAYNKGIFIPDGETLSQETINQLGRSIHDPMYVNMGSIKAKKFEFLELEEKKSTTEHTKTATSFFDDCKNGTFTIPYSWNENQEKKIPDKSFLDLFIPSEEFEDALNLVKHDLNKVIQRLDMGYAGKEAIKNNYSNMIFTGKPGTGKTTIAEAIAATLHLPLYTCPTIKNGEEDEYQGKTKLGDGDDKASFKFCETPFLEGYKNGGVVVLEEFNMANAGLMMGVLGQAIEKPFILMEDGYKPVHRHPLCVIVMTCNSMTQGAQEPNEALTSRGPNVFEINDPNDDDFVNILMNQSEDVSEKTVKKVYTTFRKVLDYLTENDGNDIAAAITLRHCLAALKQIAAGSSFKRAIKNSMINAIALKDKDMASEVYDSIIETMI
jgi:MoxR-like ATPase